MKTHTEDLAQAQNKRPAEHEATVARTVKVRVAVAVDYEGHWNATGWSTAASDDDMMELATEHVGTGELRYFLTAELPIPQATDVEASVSAQDNAASK